MSNPQTQGAQSAAPQQQPSQLLKAEDVPKLQCLSEDLKQKYKPVVHNLWSIIHSKPHGSVEHNQARQKLQEFSTKLIMQEKQYRSKIKAQQQQSQGPQGPQSQPNQQNQAAQPSQPNPQSSAEQQSAQQASSAVQAARPAQPSAPQIDPEIVKHVQNFKYFLPAGGPQEGTQEGDNKVKEMRQSYLMALNKQHRATQRVKYLNSVLEQRQKSGQEIPAEILNQKAGLEKEYGSAKEFVDNFRKKQAQNKAEQEQRRAQQQQGQVQPPQQPQQLAGQQQRQASQPGIKSEGQVKLESSQISQAQLPQQFDDAQGGPAPQTQQTPQQNPQAQSQVPSLAQQHSIRQQPAQQPVGQQPQFAQPGPPQSHQQQPRPQLNPHQANIANNQHNSPHPQSAASNVSGHPVPLSHSAAVSAAQRSYSNPEGPRTATPLQLGPQGNFHTAGSREREQMNNPKMPIPRSLTVTQPAAVGMGQARPTMSGPTNGAPGPMGQPVIAKFPPFQLEGEADRVLSKRKLDELVRQVTGGSEEALTPEVEEAVLQLADDFVDTVISNACKLSKLRESTQLDVRDIQLILERNYNIRIPGYASDEVRTVRRLVPAPGWTQKMNAVQAAKVMGGKTDI